MSWRTVVVLVGALVAGCGSGSDGDASGAGGSGSTGPGAGGASPGAGGSGTGGTSSTTGGAAGQPCPTTPAESAQNKVIFDALEPTCAGCHLTGARGYFASLSSFESLLVYQPSLVTPGDPDASRLVQLLEGKAPGTYAQMPVAGAPYAQMPGVLPMAAIREWITKLQSHTADPLPDIKAPRITRLNASEIVRTLYQQLGLSEEDFFIPATSYGFAARSAKGDDIYPILSPDALPAPFEYLPTARFVSLGGGSAALQLANDTSLAPAFVGSLTQVSQRWCLMALTKPGNTALQPASLTVGSSAPDSVKATLRAWFLHFHAVVATEADVDDVFTRVFVPTEKGKDTATAYVGTCSYFIRHPDWIFY